MMVGSFYPEAAANEFIHHLFASIKICTCGLASTSSNHSSSRGSRIWFYTFKIQLLLLSKPARSTILSSIINHHHVDTLIRRSHETLHSFIDDDERSFDGG